MAAATPPRRKAFELSQDDRRAVLQALLQRKNGHDLCRGAIQEVAAQFGVGRNTIGRIWARAKQSVADGSPLMDVSSRKNRRGRKKKDYAAELAAFPEIPLRQRATLRSAAHASGIPRTTLWKKLSEGRIRAHTNSIKPTLTEENKMKRAEFCQAHVNAQTRLFDDMEDVIHVDEKWFYITQTARKFYLLNDEPDPYRTTKSKRFVTKVMFLAAVARPRWDRCRNSYFSGKLGVWPFVTFEIARRSSRNRPAGTLVTKPMTSVTNVEYRQVLINKLLPAIAEKWPRGTIRNRIKIQQDNARSHIAPTDPAFNTAAAQLNLNVELVFQPANSPDLNVLDLGYFNAIQSLQQKKAPTDVDQLIAAVQSSFNDLQRATLNNTFLTLQMVMEQIIMCDGHNNYKLQHMSKEKLERIGRLPTSITVSEDVLNKINRD